MSARALALALALHLQAAITDKEAKLVAADALLCQVQDRLCQVQDRRDELREQLAGLLAERGGLAERSRLAAEQQPERKDGTPTPGPVVIPPVARLHSRAAFIQLAAAHPSNSATAVPAAPVRACAVASLFCVTRSFFCCIFLFFGAAAAAPDDDGVALALALHAHAFTRSPSCALPPALALVRSRWCSRSLLRQGTDERRLAMLDRLDPTAQRQLERADEVHVQSLRNGGVFTSYVDGGRLTGLIESAPPDF